MASKYSISNYKSFLILVSWECKLIIAALITTFTDLMPLNLYRAKLISLCVSTLNISYIQFSYSVTP